MCLGVSLPAPAWAATGTLHLQVTDEATGQAPAAGFHVSVTANGAEVLDLDEPAGTTSVDHSVTWQSSAPATIIATVTPVERYDENDSSGSMPSDGSLDLFVALTPWPQFTSTRTPTVAGLARVGSTLSASVPGWEPAASFAYQWLRDGTPIAHATAASYHLVGTDFSRRLSVAVTGSAPHTWTTTVTSVPTSPVRSPATVHVHATSPAHHHVKLSIRVSAPGTTPRGHVSIKHNGVVLRKPSLTDGGVVVRLRHVHSGRQKYTVVYPTTGLVDGAVARVRVHVL